MKISFSPSLEQREKADLLVLPFWEGGKEAAESGSLKDFYRSALETGDFKGKKGENLLLYVQGGLEPRILLLGLGKGEKISSEILRSCYANATRTALGKKVKVLNFLFPQVKGREALQGIAEGVFLANYAFDQLKGDSLKESPTVLLEKMQWIGIGEKEKPLFQRVEAVEGS